MLYHRHYPIEFNHCDPAGIVFYPRYFEMTNHICENFFREAVGRSFAEMMAVRTGVPTARIEVDFRAPSYLGDVLDVTLKILKLGRASAMVDITAHHQTEHRLTATITVVWVDSLKPAPWPEAMRLKMQDYLAP